MCGIIGAISSQNVVPLLIYGLKHLEYRGYDSVGLAVLSEEGTLDCVKVVGKIPALEDALKAHPLKGFTGIAHTRWATHGKPCQKNAHPHLVANRVALVHNGIIENHEGLRHQLKNKGYSFLSDTDSELIAISIYDKLQHGINFLEAVQKTTDALEGSYAMAIMDAHQPGRIIAVRSGPPLILGMCDNAYFIASDVLTFEANVKNVIYLEDGDSVDIQKTGFKIYQKSKPVQRKMHAFEFKKNSIDKAGYPHFMLKEIFEQPNAILNTLEGRFFDNHILAETFGVNAVSVFNKTKRIQIIACGSSYYAGLVGRLWLESIANMPCQVEIASEFRYRKRAKEDNAQTLFVFISQSGETADTLAALKSVSEDTVSSTLAICNIANSSLVREAKLSFMTNAGTEIGVCSTKTFTTQLAAVFLLAAALGHYSEVDLKNIPKTMEKVLSSANHIEALAPLFNEKTHAIFLGRGLQCPIADEGALKLKEISYIPAEAYPAGELKHGPLALVDKDSIIVVLAPNDSLLSKLKSNIQEVQARNGELIIFAPKSAQIIPEDKVHVVEMPEENALLTPFIYSLSVQLLAYYVAVLKKTNIDQPRNLAKSVTVE